MNRIAIDGPSGAGKSTIAKALAKKLDIDYIDTGAMYRALAYKLLINNIDLKDEEKIGKLLVETEVDFIKGNIILDGEVVNDLIRSSQVSQKASECSALKLVREKLVSLQRKMAESKSLIMDGRDIGTNVLKDAEYKFFMTASSEERAERRYKELKEKDEKITYEEVLKDIIERDFKDTNRKLNPLKKAEDAIEIDTTGKTIEEVVSSIVKEIK